MYECYINSCLDPLATAMICWFIRYHEGIRALVAQLLKKMQYNHNAEQLEALDDESIDDDVSYFVLSESY